MVCCNTDNDHSKLGFVLVCALSENKSGWQVISQLVDHWGSSRFSHTIQVLSACSLITTKQALPFSYILWPGQIRQHVEFSSMTSTHDKPATRFQEKFFEIMHQASLPLRKFKNLFSVGPGNKKALRAGDQGQTSVFYTIIQVTAQCK